MLGSPGKTLALERAAKLASKGKTGTTKELPHLAEGAVSGPIGGDTQEKSTGEAPMDLNATLPKALFIYSDIVEPQVVGDVSAPLLRIVGVEHEQFNRTVVQTYSPPHYVSVLKRQFETIEMDIRDDTGARIPFQSGRVIVKLHFR